MKEPRYTSTSAWVGSPGLWRGFTRRSSPDSPYLRLILEVFQDRLIYSTVL